jgi:hypothetical protein
MVEIMIRLYCEEHHSKARPAETRNVADAKGSGLCADCADLLDYSLHRIERCPFGAEKPTCARCAVHCFRPERREQIRAVMRYSGPRMTLRHPYLALRHLLDRR